MITTSIDAKDGKTKSWMYTVGAIVVSGILTAVVLTICKKPLHALEQAVS